MTDFEGDFYRTGGLLEGGVFYKEDYFFEKVFCGNGVEKSCNGDARWLTEDFLVGGVFEAGQREGFFHGRPALFK